jgi:hypothetical protein
MKMIMWVLSLGLITFVSVAGALSASESRAIDENTEWIARSLKEMETVKVGMTREELLTVFKEEGGISTRTWRRYVYRDCPYVKVDVEFAPVGAPEDRLSQRPEDKIIKISKPFLEWSISD